MNASNDLDSSLNLEPQEIAWTNVGDNIAADNSMSYLKETYIVPDQFFPGNVYIPEYLSLEDLDNNKKGRLFIKSLPELVELQK